MKDTNITITNNLTKNLVYLGWTCN